jgi:serine/threonine protein kinase
MGNDELDEMEISVVTFEAPPEERDADDATPLAGEQFGKYMLVGEIALGGMAEVFVAVHQGPEGFLKVVTLKRVLPRLTASPDFVRMFVDEARLAARLEHPNIVRTYEFGEHEGQYFTVMEYLAGEDLGHLLNRASISRQPLPLNLAASIVGQICNGLHFAHDLTDVVGRPLSLVHRDVNPSNVIITYTGEVKIIDFGVAKARTNHSKTLAGTIKGKIAYMAPEQILARGIDRRSDVFSVGVLLWEVLAGRPLFARETEAATLYAVMNDPIPSVRKLRPEVPDELERIVMRALARTPADRYDTAEEMSLALDAFANAQPKLETRALARTMESLFGSTRAEAKRSIAQTRALKKNVSLVMKLRSEVRADLAEQLASQSKPTRDLHGPRPTSRGLLFGIAGAALLATAVGLVYVESRDGHSKQAAAAGAPTGEGTLELASTPAGAAIFIAGEPTGLKTPATVTGVHPGEVAIRLELAGHVPKAVTVSVSPGQTLEQRLTLVGLSGRLVISNLPVGAIVALDGQEHQAGEVFTIPSGRHDVKLLVAGHPLLQQTIETTAGDQTWELADDRLIRR